MQLEGQTFRHINKSDSIRFKLEYPGRHIARCPLRPSLKSRIHFSGLTSFILSLRLKFLLAVFGSIFNSLARDSRSQPVDVHANLRPALDAKVQ